MDEQRMTAEEYLRTEFEPEAEFADGAVQPRNTGTEAHSRWQGAIMFYFAQHARNWGIRVRPILRIRINEQRYRVPDIALFDASAPEENIPTRPPMAVFEVLDPEDRFTHTMTRFADFERMGVHSIYMVDPDNNSFTRYQAGSLYMRLATLTVGTHTIPVQELVDVLD